MEKHQSPVTKKHSAAYFTMTLEKPILLYIDVYVGGFPGSACGKEPICRCRRRKRHGFDPWVGKIPWRRAWQSTPVFLLGESQGQRSLVGYSLRGCKESNMTEAT